MSNHNNLSKSPMVYMANAACVMTCLGSIIFTSLQPNIDASVIAVVAGTAGTIAGSIITIMLKSTGAEEKPDPMHQVALQLLENMNEQVTVEDNKVIVNRGSQSTTVDR